MVKGILFDLDGTLLNTLKDLKNAVNFSLRNLAMEEISLAQTKQYIGNGVRKLIERALTEKNANFVEKALCDFKSYYESHLIDETTPYEGVIETLVNLKKHGYKLAVVSNKYHLGVEKICNHFFEGLFDFYIGGQENIPLKPSNEMINITLKALSLSNNECVFVGDSDVDILTAKNANIPCIALTYGYKDVDVLEKCKPNYITSSFKNIINIIKEINHE